MAGLRIAPDTSCCPATAVTHAPLLLLLLLQDVKLPSIAGTVIANSNLNLLGMGATLIALQVWRAGGRAQNCRWRWLAGQPRASTWSHAF